VLAAGWVGMNEAIAKTLAEACNLSFEQDLHDFIKSVDHLCYKKMCSQSYQNHQKM
jgi:hypothetical protein